jgi:hypothetical protein
MDFFRLDYLSEVDRNNYHNFFMDNIKPINRKENFEKFNQIRKNIKYLDYLKENRLLNQNQNLIRNIYSDKEIEIANLRKKYYNNRNEENNDKLPGIINNNNDLNNNINQENERYLNNNINEEKKSSYKNLFKNRVINSYKVRNNDNNINKSAMALSNRCELKPNKRISNSYLSNINDYSIKEGDKNLYPERARVKLRPIFPKNFINSEQIRNLYNVKKFMKESDGPFYAAYNEINKNGGFYKRKEDISKDDKIRQNKIYFRNNKNEYKDMKNFNSINFHKKKFNTIDY